MNETKSESTTKKILSLNMAMHELIATAQTVEATSYLANDILIAFTDPLSKGDPKNSKSFVLDENGTTFPEIISNLSRFIMEKIREMEIDLNELKEIIG